MNKKYKRIHKQNDRNIFFIILFKGLRNYYIDNCIIVSKNPHMAVQMQ